MRIAYIVIAVKKSKRETEVRLDRVAPKEYQYPRWQTVVRRLDTELLFCRISSKLLMDAERNSVVFCSFKSRSQPAIYLAQAPAKPQEVCTSEAAQTPVIGFQLDARAMSNSMVWCESEYKTWFWCTYRFITFVLWINRPLESILLHCLWTSVFSKCLLQVHTLRQ